MAAATIIACMGSTACGTEKNPKTIQTTIRQHELRALPEGASESTLVYHHRMHSRLRQEMLELIGMKNIAASRVFENPGDSVLPGTSQNIQGVTHQQVTLLQRSEIVRRKRSCGKRGVPWLCGGPDDVGPVPCDTPGSTRRGDHQTQDLSTTDRPADLTHPAAAFQTMRPAYSNIQNLRKESQPKTPRATRPVPPKRSSM